jgi:hypothetical protein
MCCRAVATCCALLCFLVGASSTLAAPSRAGRVRPAAARCRDIFCTAQRVAIGEREGPGLRYEHVVQVMKRIKPQLIPCAIDERRRDPELQRAEIEFVVSPAGRVLATRVNGQRRSRLSRCIHQRMSRLARFPRGAQRQVASFALTVLN